jgi:ribonuclease D
MVRVVDTEAGLERELEALSRAESIAVDTEFHPERSYLPRLFLVQVCGDGGEPVLIDPLALSLAPLGAVLTRARVVVHGGDWDLRLLAHHAGFVPTRVSDTQRVAAFAGLGWPRRLQDLLLEVLGTELDKGSTLSDWSRRPLSAAQLAYAAADVRLLLELDRVLRERVASFGNAEWLARAEADHLDEVLRPVDPDRAWRRVPGAQLLDARSRTALQALAAWREKQARSADVPLNQVVPDAHLLDLARRRPGSLEEMRENRRFPSSVWKVHGAALLGCLQEDGRNPPAALPRGVRVELLRAAARAAASPRGMAGELLLSDCEMEYILAGSGSPSWRLQALGPDFTGFRQGRVLLNFDGDLVPG